MKNMLMSIIGYSEILQDEIQYSMENGEIHYIINNLSDSAKRFNNMVQKFTNYTNAALLLNDPEAAKNIRKRSISSPKMIIQMGALNAAERHKRIQDLKFDLADTELFYDEFYLSYMVEELVDNAMKYSVRDSKVIVRSFIDGNEFVISIIDSGIGMSLEQISEIAEFNQFSAPLMGRIGNGVGLVTVKRIAEVTGLDFCIISDIGEYTEVSIAFKLN